MAMRPKHDRLIRSPVALVRPQVPKSNRSGKIARGQELFVRAKPQTQYSERVGFVTGKSGDQLTRVEIPNLNDCRNARCGDQTTVRRNIATQDREFSWLKSFELPESGCVPKLQFTSPVRCVQPTAR